MSFLLRSNSSELVGKELFHKTDAFKLYNFLCSNLKINKDEIFLLESMSLNNIDSNESIIGLNKLLNIQVKNKKLLILGKKQIRELIYSAIKNGYECCWSNSILDISLKEKNDIWNLLRLIENLLKIPEPSDKRGTIFFGFFGYDTIHYIEEINTYEEDPGDLINTDEEDLDDLPVINLSLYEHIITLLDFDANLTTYSISSKDSHNDFLNLLSMFKKENYEKLAPLEETYPFRVSFETAKNSYLEKSSKALNHIKIGDIYQIQIGQKLTIETEIDAVSVYNNLRQQNPSPYMYLFHVDEYTIVGASPELFIKISEKDIVMRPIAGTIGKAIVSNKAEALSHLHANEKEVAEHLMLVDLCRNDLHRVCEAETVAISNLMGIEEYSHVYHMVSSASGRLSFQNDKFDAIQATFPAGTMTGAPKIRAMELIAEIEDSRRGLYAGAIGLIGFGANYMNTALCIRTSIKKENRYSLRASAGIVCDSLPRSEYDETLHKLGSMFKAITGQEILCHVK